MTLEDLVRICTLRLKHAGIPSADSGREARIILAWALGLDAIGLITRADHTPTQGEITKIKTLIERRAKREPLQHIIGEVEFFGLRFKADRRALIPRPDSETLVEVVLGALPQNFDGLIADLGTGSGCLLGAVLANRQMANSLAVEASADAATLAGENFVRLGLEKRVKVWQGSWADTDAWLAADVIMSNPPYIETDDLQRLAPEVRSFDPLAALHGGTDGLDAYRSILAKSNAIKPSTLLVFEMGWNQAEALSELCRGAGYKDIEIHKDLGGNDRVVSCRRA